MFSQNIIEGFAQGTSYRVLYYSPDKNITKSSIDSILIKLDSSLSTYKKYSLISRFNEPDCSHIIPDIHLRNVIQSSLKHYKLSRGSFDITVGSLNANPELVPAQIGMDKISLTDSLLIKKSSVIKLDVDGIAQGYSVDVIADFLENQEIRNYLVELGGEIRTSGSHPNQKKFKIAIEVPSKDATGKDLVFKTIEIFNTAVTTSGKIRENGSKHHIDAETGKLTQSSTLYATVITPKAIDADALDNYLLTLPYKKAFKLVRKMKNVQLMLIVENKNKGLIVKKTKGFPAML